MHKRLSMIIGLIAAIIALIFIVLFLQGLNKPLKEEAPTENVDQVDVMDVEEDDQVMKDLGGDVLLKVIVEGEPNLSNLDQQINGDKREVLVASVESMGDVFVNHEIPGGHFEPGHAQLASNLNGEETKDVKLYAVGNFRDVAFRGTGFAKIIELPRTKQLMLRLNHLRIKNGPDLRVVLSENTDVRTVEQLGEYYEVGQLFGNIGSSNMPLPPNFDSSKYNSVVILSKPYNVVFNSANLRR